MRKNAQDGLSFAATRRGSVTVMFAGMAIPLVMVCGLAMDYSFYLQTQSVLDTAANTAALHAVRVAYQAFENGSSASAATVAGQQAGQQWFASQAGNVPNLKSALNITVNPVSYNANTSTFTDTVSYSGYVATHVGSILKVTQQWPIGGTSSATISASSYVEVMMLVDNSSSMLIGASPADIIKMENLTICSPTVTAIAAGQQLTGTYSWIYPSGIGYGTNSNGTLQTVPTSTTQGACDTNFSGGAAQCPSPKSYASVNAYGFCPTGTGIPDINKRIDPSTRTIANIPQAPCAFACHTGDGINDYYTLARKASSPPVLRFDVIQSAMSNVITAIAAKPNAATLYTVGVYAFNSVLAPVHPSLYTGAEADNNFAQALTDVSNLASPVVSDSPNTNFIDAIQTVAGNVTQAGDGSSPNAGGTTISRRKNIFIITDGLEDYSPTNRTIGPMTALNPEPYCSQLKNKGFNIYVLYTPYYPLPNEFYLNNGPRGSVEPTVPPATTNPIIAALQACASTPTQFYQAADSTSINAALAEMLQSATASPGRITY